MANSNVDAWIPEIWAQEALRHLKANLILARLINRDYDSEVAQSGDVINVPIPPILAAANKVAGTPISPAAVSAATTPVPLNQHVYSAFEVDNIQRIQSRPDVLSNYGRSAAIAVAERIESDLLAQYVNAGEAVGTSGSALDKENLLAARTALSVAKVPASEGRWALVAPQDAEELLGDLSNTDATANAGDRSALRDGRIGRLYGFDVYESQLAPVGGGAQHGLAGHRDGIVLVTRPLEAPEGAGVRVGSVSDPDIAMTMRVMMSYNHLNMQEVVTYDVLYGIATVRASFTVDLVSAVPAGS